MPGRASLGALYGGLGGLLAGLVAGQTIRALDAQTGSLLIMVPTLGTLIAFVAPVAMGATCAIAGLAIGVFELGPRRGALVGLIANLPLLAVVLSRSPPLVLAAELLFFGGVAAALGALTAALIVGGSARRAAVTGDRRRHS